MDAREALQAHLREDPDDIQSWRVFADLLLDEGDLRGRLISLEIERSDPHTTGARREILARELAGLRLACRRRALEGISTPPGLSLIWRYGFIEGLILRRRAVEEALQIVRCERERLLSRLELSLLSLDEEELTAIASEALPSLRSLSFGSVRLGDRGVETLARGGLRQLRELRLRGAQIAADGARLLSEAVGSLRALDLGWNPLGDEGVIALANSGQLIELRQLSLPSVQMSDDAASILIGEALSEELEHLDLSGNGITDITVRTILRAGLRSLRSIDVSETALTSTGLSALANRERCPALERLVFRGIHIGDAGMAASFMRHLREKGITR